MNIKGTVKVWRAFVGKMNDKGIPIPVLRDPATDEGSVSFTLVVISTALVVAGIVGKWAGWLGGIDMVNAMQFLGMACTYHFGHSWVHREDKKLHRNKAADPQAGAEASARADDPDA